MPMATGAVVLLGASAARVVMSTPSALAMPSAEVTATTDPTPQPGQPPAGSRV